MAAPRLNPFEIDVERINQPELYRQLTKHRDEPNRPCNCSLCIARFLTNGGAFVVKKRHPETNEFMWVPFVFPPEDMRQGVKSYSSKQMRDMFVTTCHGDIEHFASMIISQKLRAYPHDFSSVSDVFFLDNKKRRAPRDDAPPAKKPANTTMPARELFPKSPAAASSSDKGKGRAEVDLSNDEDDEEEETGGGASPMRPAMEEDDDERTLSDAEN